MDIQAFNKEVRKYLRKINLKNCQRMNRCIRPFHITPSQMAILFHLEHHGELSISELVKRTEHPKSNVSAICTRLEENGLIIRRRSETDQRVVYASLTNHARTMLEQVKRAVDTEQDRLAEKLDENQREQILQGLMLLSEMLD